MRILLTTAAVLGAALTGCGGNDDGKLKVAAAASLTGAYEELGEVFTEKTGIEVKFSFASSGKLAQQLENGAPYDVYAAASISYIDRVIEAGAAIADTRRSYARGRLVAWVASGEAPASPGDLRDERFAKIAIAQPEHAPYGMAAREAMRKAGLWDAVQGRVVYGSNVRQAMQYAESGNAEVAIIALSLALKGGGDYLLLDEDLHAPLEQGVVVCEDSKRRDDATKFVDFVDSEEGHAILARYGLLQPGQSMPH